ncbi:MarR family winged helix-turn-helix transcriptional regulator [Myroides sp. DW712]|uniref:MarR family winged helix-turn-helix transcriptional regulator n=1 Tax=Myroides sp. DW712 TaxID=3389800 RepID=UPI00397D2B11
MNHKLLIEFMYLLFEFEQNAERETVSCYTQNIEGFKQWIREKNEEPTVSKEFEVTDEKVTTEQQIALDLYKLANYSKMYWRVLLREGTFASQDNFIVLLNLWMHGAMTKMELIRMSAQEKPTGMQIINRLIQSEFVQQKDSQVDKRSKIIEITTLGQRELEKQMEEIQRVSLVINGNLGGKDKQQLQLLLQRLIDFHEEVFMEHKSKTDLLDLVLAHKVK